jgi:hypothetical protein
MEERMADPILPNSPPKEPHKTESVLNLGFFRDQAPIITKSIHTLDAGYLAEILEETALNLTRLHECLTEIETMLLKGGGR